MMAYVIIRQPKTDAVEIHFISNTKFDHLHLGAIYSDKKTVWSRPPDVHPLEHSNLGEVINVKFIYNDMIFSKPVYMIQYRISNYTSNKFDKSLDALVFNIFETSDRTISEYEKSDVITIDMKEK